MRLKLITIFAVILSNFSFAQKPSLIGSWKMIKHIASVNGDKNYDCLKHMDGQTEELIFYKDGLYKLFWTNKKGIVTMTTKGKWKISSDNKKFSLYDSKFDPNPNKDIVGDLPEVTIIKLTPTEFVFKENLCTEGTQGTSYFTRRK